MANCKRHKFKQMKTHNLILPILMLITILSSCESAKTPPSKTPEDFARTVFLSLKTKNVDLYESTVPSFNEIKNLQNKIGDNNEFTEEDFKDKKANRLKWFFDTIKEAEENHLNLTESNYCGFMGKIDTINNLIIIPDGYICFEIGYQKYYIVADKIFQINSEWKSVENLLGIQSQID